MSGSAVSYAIGIDEAGRGCVIGPLVVAGFLAPDTAATEKSLRAGGVRDSKKLTPRAREEIMRFLRSSHRVFKTVRLSPGKIDTHSINILESCASAMLVASLAAHSDYAISNAYIDVPARGAALNAYCADVHTKSKRPEIAIIGGNHMDVTNVLVSAASIVAKTTRDRLCALLKNEYGEFGSGYPSDPRTRAWLAAWWRQHGSWPPIVRTKWSTVSWLSRR